MSEPYQPGPGVKGGRPCQDRLVMMMEKVDFQGLDVLDIGCSTGWFCRAVKRLGADRVVGVEFGAAEIRDAIRFASLEGLEGIEFRRACDALAAIPDYAVALTFDRACDIGLIDADQRDTGRDFLLERKNKIWDLTR